VVLYRYRDGLIGQRELYYDPSGALEVLEPASGVTGRSAPPGSA